MDSPAPRLSESNLRKLSRGLRSSKKSRLSVHSALETQSVQDGSLGGRSVSLSTLLPSGGAPGSVPRVDKLQSLEAKMASIEMSLGWRRRREALLETLPRAARDLVRELDTLHQTVREKENCIQGLRTQITNLGGTVTGPNDGSCGVVSESERKTIQERLTKVEAEIEAKKVAVKNLKLALDKIDITDNIDVRIQAAELEYELEREELNILNLKEESSVLTIRLQESCLVSPLAEGALTEGPKTRISFQELLAVPGNPSIVAGVSLISANVSHTPGNPPFHVTFRPPFGCVIDWATDDTRLKKGDRIVEINGEIVLGKNIDDVTKFMSTSSHLALVVARPIDSVSVTRKLEKQLEEKSKENKELVVKMEKILKERETCKNDNTRLSHRIGYLEDQVSELQLTLQKAKDTAIITGSPNEVLTPSQPGATIIQVFQKGHQTLAVAGTEVKTSETRVHEYPTLPRLKSPSCSSFDTASNGPMDEKGANETRCKDLDKNDDPPPPYHCLDAVNSHSPSVLDQPFSQPGAMHQHQGATALGPRRAINDLSDHHTINIKCKLDPTSGRSYRQDDTCDYDCIEKLRDRLTKKSPSYSYKNPSDFPDDPRGSRNCADDIPKAKKHDNLELNNSFSKGNPCRLPTHQPQKRESEETLPDFHPTSREDSSSLEAPKSSEGGETRLSRSVNGCERPSRRVVSPGLEDTKPLRPRPIPPKKPERLSLQRTTSMQSVEDSRSCSRTSSASNPLRGHGYRNAGSYSSSENIFCNGELSSFSISGSNSNSSEERRSTVSPPGEEGALRPTPIPSPRNFTQNSHNKISHHHNRSNHHNFRESRRLTLASLESSLNGEIPLPTNTHSPRIPAHSPLNPLHTEQSLTPLSLNSPHPIYLPINSTNSPRISTNLPHNSAHSPQLTPKLSPMSNGHRPCSRSKLSDSSSNLEASLGLDLHEEVRAQPLYEYLRQAHDTVPTANHRPSRHATPRVHNKGGFEAPPTPNTPPRGINLSMKISGREGEEWC